jgi:lysophospholipase L1-like esterase
MIRLLATCVFLVIAARHAGAQTPATRLRQPDSTRIKAQLAAEDERLRNDWASLQKFGSVNARLPAPAAAEDRVVFMGNSIFEVWARAFGTMFPGKPYINRGIGGQTTPQMLVRFRPDVIELKPKVVVILAGTNDIAGNTGPSTLEMIENNIASMSELAKANGIRVVLASVLPVSVYPWRPRVRQPAQKVVALNSWIRDYARRNGHVYLDYHSAMTDQRMGMRADLSGDGVHPNEAGYRIMMPLTLAAIREALRE